MAIVIKISVEDSRTQETEPGTVVTHVPDMRRRMCSHHVVLSHMGCGRENVPEPRFQFYHSVRVCGDLVKNLFEMGRHYQFWS